MVVVTRPSSSQFSSTQWTMTFATGLSERKLDPSRQRLRHPFRHARVPVGAAMSPDDPTEGLEAEPLVPADARGEPNVVAPQIHRCEFRRPAPELEPHVVEREG